MTIQIDTREKPTAIKRIVAHLDKCGIQHYKSKLFVGDYMNIDNPRIVVDRKKDLLELAGNVAQDHKRFAAELAKSNEYGIKLIILCEHGESIKSLEDVQKWKNPRLNKSPLAISGERLYKILLAMSKKYGAEIHFCEKRQTGAEIIRLLQTDVTPADKNVNDNTLLRG